MQLKKTIIVPSVKFLSTLSPKEGLFFHGRSHGGILIKRSQDDVIKTERHSPIKHILSARINCLSPTPDPTIRQPSPLKNATIIESYLPQAYNVNTDTTVSVDSKTETDQHPTAIRSENKIVDIAFQRPMPKKKLTLKSGNRSQLSNFGSNCNSGNKGTQSILSHRLINK